MTSYFSTALSAISSSSPLAYHRCYTLCLLWIIANVAARKGATAHALRMLWDPVRVRHASARLIGSMEAYLYDLSECTRYLVVHVARAETAISRTTY